MVAWFSIKDFFRMSSMDVKVLPRFDTRLGRSMNFVTSSFSFFELAELEAGEAGEKGFD